MSVFTRLAGALLIVALTPAGAAEFRAIADNAAILYDAPSTKAKRLYLIGRNYPVEIVVVLEGWTKVRDANGDLSWVESKNLSERRTVMVKVKLADVRQAAADNAPLAFQAEQDVLLELIEITPTGWARISHRDGQSGYVKLSQIWGV